MDSYYRRNQKPHHEHHKRRIHLGFIVILIILVYSTYALFRPLAPITAAAAETTNSTSLVKADLAWPAGAESAIGTESEGVLATSSEHQGPLPTASIAKLITALTVLREFPLTVGQQGPTITLGKADVQLYEKYYAKNGSLVKIEAGEKLSEHEALEAMLLPSGNNMADSLAIWAFGSLEQYRTAAQNEIATLGLNETVIGDDASGFSPGTKSSPSDLIKLGQVVLANPLLRQIVSEKSATIPVAGKIHNTNYLLGTSGIMGIKTGNSDQAGGCILFAAEHKFADDTITIIGAIQHTPQLVDAMRAVTPLLKSAEKFFKVRTVAATGQTVAEYNIPWMSEPVQAVAQHSLTLPVWPGTTPEHALKTKDFKSPKLIDGQFSPIEAGAVVGTLTVGGDGSAKSTPVVIRQSIERPSVFWRLTHPY